MGRTERASSGVTFVGALAVAVVLVLTAVAVVRDVRADELRRADEVDRAAIVVVAELRTAFEARLATAVDLGRGVAAGGPATTPSGFLAAVVVEADAPDSAGDLGALGDPLDESTVRAALDLARDTGEVVLSAPVVTDEATAPVVVVPVFELADGTRSIESDRRGVGRRETIRQWVVLALDSPALVVDAHSAASGADLGVEVADGEVVHAPATAPLGFATRDVEFPALDRVWNVAVGAASAPPFPSSAWLIGGIGVVVAAGLSLATAVARRRQRRIDDDFALASDQLKLVSDVAPLVQESLDLGALLPGVCLRLSDHLDLAGVACSVLTPDGRNVDVFSHGSPVADDVRAQLAMPSHLDAGASFARSLERGARAVGTLRIRAGRELSAAELRTVDTVAELIGAAVTNARAFEEQVDAVNRLREVDELKTVFIGTASHELRTPVTAILGFARVLERRWDDFDDERRRDMLRRVANNADALDALVGDLLDVSRLDQGRRATSLERLSLGSVVSDVLDRLEPNYEGHRLVARADPSLDVLADRPGLERIVENLVSNAVKYSPEGSTVTISVEAAHGGGTLLLVDDEGGGVAAENRERIFARFYRGHGQEVVQTRGAGIGLSVVAGLCQQFDAEVDVIDAPTGGARFRVRFPAVPAASEPDRATAEEETQHVPSE